jgi:DNA-directed RNA polymerase subunit beta'
MAVHVPLSVESQIEARVLMLPPTISCRRPTAAPIIVPSQDIVLGTYYMTLGIDGRKGEGKVFANPEEVRIAYDARKVDLHAKIVVRIGAKRHDTTVGRILLWEIMPKDHLIVMRHEWSIHRRRPQVILDQIQAGPISSNMVQTHSQSSDKAQDGSSGCCARMSSSGFSMPGRGCRRRLRVWPKAMVSRSSRPTTGIICFRCWKTAGDALRGGQPGHGQKALRDLVDFAYRNLGPRPPSFFPTGSRIPATNIRPRAVFPFPSTT